MESPISNLVNALDRSCQAHMDTLASYYRLATCGELSDEDADHLADIYQKAESAPLLNFLINEVDHILNRRLGLLTEDCIKNYKNQQSYLREHLEEMPFDSQYRRDMQKLLNDLAYYQGPVDGVIGKRSNEALKQFYMTVQEMLAQQGFFNKEAVDGELDAECITAVKRFQQAKEIEDDGVPGPETFQKLKQKD